MIRAEKRTDEPPPNRLEASEEWLTRAITRGLTRRTVFKRAMRGTLIVGGVLSAPLAFSSTASATSCNGMTPWGGCQCEPSTPNCGELGAGCTPEGACNPGSGLRVRCTYWSQQDGQGQYCWCSQTCNYGGGVIGKRVCCDCWKGGSGGCGTGNGGQKCLCASWHTA
jgi:hypothetical protein